MNEPATYTPAAQPRAPGAARRIARSLAGAKARGPLLVACAALGAAVLGWAVHSGRFTKISGFDRIAESQQADRAAAFLRTVRAQRSDRAGLVARLTGVSDATLGDRLDVVDGALRARLNRIAEETGLRDLMVATAAATERRNPARSEMTRLKLPRGLRDEPDFVEVRATVSGEGAVDQVFRLVHRIAVDPMLKRIEMVKFDPARDGGRVRVTLKLATIYLPGRPPTGLPGAPNAEALAAFAKYAALAQRNPFRLPEPATPTVAAPAAIAAAPEPGAPGAAAPGAEPIAGFPYGQWLLTGVIDGPAGMEAWFRNSATQEARVLRANDTIAEFALVGLAPEGARIAASGATYTLRVGDALDARAAEAAPR